MLGTVLAVAFAVSSPIRALQYSLHSGALVGVWAMALIMAIILTLVALNNEGSAKFYEVLETGFWLASLDSKNSNRETWSCVILRMRSMQGQKTPEKFFWQRTASYIC